MSLNLIRIVNSDQFRRRWLCAFIVAFVLAGNAAAVELTKENLFQLATLAVRDGEYEHALDFFKRAIEIDPHFVPAYNSIGVVYESSPAANLEEAVRYFKLATDIAPTVVESWNNLGRAYYTKGEFQNSERAFLRSLVLKPQQPEVEISLGWVYLLGQSRGAEAVEHFQKGLAGSEPNVMVYYGMGLANMIEGERFKVLEAITQLRKVRREDLALKLEDLLKNKVKLTSRPGTPLITGGGDEHAVLNDQLKTLGRAEGNTEGIKVRLKGPIRN